jgi:hypothetical protein
MREGDKRTPEGIYWVDWRKKSDKFNLAMHISYPNISDAATARREGVKPGFDDHDPRHARQRRQPGRAVPHPGLDRWLHRHEKPRDARSVEPGS